MVSRFLSTGLAALVVSATAAAGDSASPRWLVFEASAQQGSQPAQLFRMRSTGTGLQQLTTGLAARDPNFSPKGKSIVFARHGRGIFVIDIKGKHQRRLTRGSTDAFPVHSPDGSQIAFLRDRMLWVMRADGRGERRVAVALSHVTRPSWTPDGKSVVLGAEGAADDVYQVNVRSGRIEKALPFDFEADVDSVTPTLSPDGRTLAFNDYRPEPPGCQKIACEVYALYLGKPASGTSKRFADDAGPAGWSSDGSTLAYGTRGAIELRPARGGAPARIETGSTVVIGEAPPTWQPG